MLHVFSFPSLPFPSPHAWCSLHDPYCKFDILLSVIPENFLILGTGKYIAKHIVVQQRAVSSVKDWEAGIIRGCSWAGRKVHWLCEQPVCCAACTHQAQVRILQLVPFLTV